MFKEFNFKVQSSKAKHIKVIRVRIPVNDANKNTLEAQNDKKTPKPTIEFIFQCHASAANCDYDTWLDKCDATVEEPTSFLTNIRRLGKFSTDKNSAQNKEYKYHFVIKSKSLCQKTIEELGKDPLYCEKNKKLIKELKNLDFNYNPKIAPASISAKQLTNRKPRHKLTERHNTELVTYNGEQYIFKHLPINKKITDWETILYELIWIMLGNKHAPRALSVVDDANGYMERIGLIIEYKDKFIPYNQLSFPPFSTKQKLIQGGFIQMVDAAKRIEEYDLHSNNWGGDPYFIILDHDWAWPARLGKYQGIDPRAKPRYLKPQAHTTRQEITIECPPAEAFPCSQQDKKNFLLLKDAQPFNFPDRSLNSPDINTLQSIEKDPEARAIHFKAELTHILLCKHSVAEIAKRYLGTDSARNDFILWQTKKANDDIQDYLEISEFRRVILQHQKELRVDIQNTVQDRNKILNNQNNKTTYQIELGAILAEYDKIIKKITILEFIAQLCQSLLSMEPTEINARLASLKMVLKDKDPETQKISINEFNRQVPESYRLDISTITQANFVKTLEEKIQLFAQQQIKNFLQKNKPKQFPPQENLTLEKITHHYIKGDITIKDFVALITLMFVKLDLEIDNSDEANILNPLKAIIAHSIWNDAGFQFFKKNSTPQSIEKMRQTNINTLKEYQNIVTEERKNNLGLFRQGRTQEIQELILNLDNNIDPKVLNIILTAFCEKWHIDIKPSAKEDPEKIKKMGI